MSKKIIIFVLIALLLIGLTGLVYSIFSTSVTRKGKNNTLIIGTLKIEYRDGTEFSLSNGANTITKEIIVSNVGTFETSYNILYKELINEIENDQLLISYNCTSYKNYVNDINKGALAGTCDNITNKAVPYFKESSDTMITQNIKISGGITHIYSFTFTLKEPTDNQNKLFRTNIEITQSDVKKLSRGSLKDVILADNPVIKKDNINLFKNIADDKNESGLFKTSLLYRNEDINEDKLGEEILYFRGIVENNYIVFANKCWRIVRTNESGSIKLRYGGDPIISSGKYSCPKTGTKIGITMNDTNAHIYSGPALNNNSKYVKWVWDGNKSSNAKTMLETWYKQNIESLGNEISSQVVDEEYCNDTSLGSNVDGTTYYGAYDRMYDNYEPQYKCPNKSDTYSVKKGNMNKPVGLLTVDEISYAGGKIDASNKEYYLYTSSDYWTMSPFMWTNSYTFMFIVKSSGAIKDFDTTVNINLIPVISIKSSLLVEEGSSGEYNNPYIIINE